MPATRAPVPSSASAGPARSSRISDAPAPTPATVNRAAVSPPSRRRASCTTTLSAAQPAAAPSAAEPTETAICSRRRRAMSEGAKDDTSASAAMYLAVSRRFMHTNRIPGGTVPLA